MTLKVNCGRLGPIVNVKFGATRQVHNNRLHGDASFYRLLRVGSYFRKLTVGRSKRALRIQWRSLAVVRLTRASLSRR